MVLLINQLTIEVRILILEALDDISSLVPALCAHRCFYDAFKAGKGIAEVIIQRQVHPHLLPLAIAAVEASHSHRGNIVERERIHELCANIDKNPGPFIDRLKARRPGRKPSSSTPIPIPDLIQIGRCHDIIKELAVGYAALAWRRFVEAPGCPIKLSAAERIRFYRAFWRLELFFMAYRGYDGTNPPIRFLHAFPPWEWEQLACVHRWLESWLLRDANVLSIWANSEAYAIDPVHRKLQIWLSQGLRLLIQLKETGSVEAKRTLLARAFESQWVSLRDAMAVAYRFRSKSSPWIKFNNNNNNNPGIRFPLKDRGPYGDLDNGPRNGWAAVHIELDGQGWWVNYDKVYTVANTAYVF
ncbi:hypothetical protein F5Y10DRAFT_287358 [Nemania abortiva]|nr:hypothetical protein F5Y10DRAFT_287358 [Nemania abortiva]